jgi:hypothetical protein
MCYINTTRHHAMIGWCGGPDTMLDLRVHADADFAGCVRAMRSTTGVALVVEGPNTRMVANGVSKRQTAVSHSTPEAEIVAADYAMRAEGMPALSLLETILERKVRLRMMEDNEAMIRICHSGENPTMRYLNRIHKVGVAWLMEVFERDCINIYKIDTKLQTADIGANRIACLDTWRSNCILINLSDQGFFLRNSVHCCRPCVWILSRNSMHAKSNSGRRLWSVRKRAQALPAHAGGVGAQVRKAETSQDEQSSL